MKLLKNGSRGDDVTVLQGKLNQLGFTVATDGIFGTQTHKAVVDMQSMFGYDVDGLVGDGTTGLIDAQIGYGWNVNAEDAQAKALVAQGKDPAKVLGKSAAKTAKDAGGKVASVAAAAKGAAGKFAGKAAPSGKAPPSGKPAPKK